MRERWIVIGWCLALAGAVGVRAWNVIEGPMLAGYDAWGHLAYVFYLDLYRSLPWPDQGWSYFHPPLHYAIGWCLAQFGSGEFLVRGLGAVGSAASLGTAVCAAVAARAVLPRFRAAGLTAFTAVAFLPVHLYVSPMIGNELTATFFAAAGLAMLISNEVRVRPSLGRDAWIGAVLGLALLTKINTAGVLASVLIVLLLRAARTGEWRRSALRGAVVATVALLLAAPFYARSFREYGTPLRMGRDNPLESQFEGAQPPGSRTWVDFIALSPRLFVDPDPLAPHLLHSIWGSAYVHTWVDARAARRHAADVTPGETHWQIEVRKLLRERSRRARSTMMFAGIVPTLLALVGAALGLRAARSGRSAGIVPLFVCAAVTLATFAAFAAGVPTFAALKASYLFPLSIPFGVFVAYSIAALGASAVGGSGALAGFALAAAAVCAGAVHSAGLVLPVLAENHLVGTLRLHFGEYALARAFFGSRLAADESDPVWAENLATVELADGEVERARELYLQSIADPGAPAVRWNALAVAAALEGDYARALEWIEEASARGGGAVALANRGAIRAARGELTLAEADLRRALEQESELVAAWRGLAEVLAALDRGEESRSARTRAEREAKIAPRGRPYGIGENLGHRPLRGIGRAWMLWLDGVQLKLARADGRGPQ